MVAAAFLATDGENNRGSKAMVDLYYAQEACDVPVGEDEYSTRGSENCRHTILESQGR
jgi:hypothetical protein